MSTIAESAGALSNDKNRRAAARLLLSELECGDTPAARKLEIVIGLAKINPGAFEHVAKIHLRGVIDPVNR